MLKKLKQIFSIKRIVWFLFVSGLFLVLYTPHLSYHVDLDSCSEGTIVLANYNTDRNEEIFETYNYNGHKTWYDVAPYYKEIAITNVPIVTNSLQMQLQGVKSMTINKITLSFGPMTVREYTSSNFTSQLAGSQGIDISLENDQIHLNLQNVEGWVQFQTEEYLPKFIIIQVYAFIMVLAWIIAVMIDKHLELSNVIPLNELMLLAAPCWVFFMMENILGNFFYINTGLRLLNVGIMIVIYKIFHLIFFRRPMGLNLANIIFTLYAIVSTFVVVFRNRPIAPWDFTALGTAMDVATNYDIRLNYIMIFAFIVDAMLYLVMRCVPRDKTKINKWYTAYPIIVLVVALFFNSIGSYYLWDIRLLSTFQNEGTTLTFTGLVRQFLENQPTKPDGYSEDKLNELKEEYSTKAKADAEADEKNTKPTTIIQIMNESFSDLDIGGTTIAEGMTPYFNSLENTIRGNLYVSVRGGGTCNTEYETLTGNSTAFFQAGVYPYNMYMNRSVPSTISYMNRNDYLTTGMHLGKSTNWNRRTAYQKLQFKDTVFAETFDGLDTIHGYPTDEQDFEKVIENYEENKGKNQFLFNVTYQNHGSYKNADDLTQTVDLTSYGNENYDTAENYLSLIKLTDEAFKKLIEYFENVDENVMIIMYGDHQPSLGSASDRLFFPTSGTPEEDIKQYVTPFLIWANYDIEDQTYDKLSANYLSSLILHTANMELTPYQQFLYELKDQYPVISLYGCYDAEGNFYESVDDIDDESIQEYRMLQYNNVFDKNRDVELFYPKSTNDKKADASTD